MSGDRDALVVAVERASARCLTVVLAEPEAALRGDLPLDARAPTPWGALARLGVGWLRDGAGSANGRTATERVRDFLAGLTPEELEKVGGGSAAHVLERMRAAVGEGRLGSSVEEFAALLEAAHALEDHHREAAEGGSAGSAGCAEEWTTPEPLTGPPLPSLDPDDLPDPFGAWTRAVSEAYQVPPELPALMGLGALSAAVAGTAVVRVGPDWSEELTLYGAVVLPPGERKSPVVKEAVAPLDLLGARGGRGVPGRGRARGAGPAAQ